MKKCFLSLLLALLMVLASVTLYAFTALAADTEAETETHPTKTTQTIEETYAYDSLYVGYNAETGTFENTSLIVDFYAATTATEIVKGANYANTDKYASERFAAEASTYTPFIVYGVVDNPITGGTAPITSPWKFKNYCTEGFWNWEEDGGGTVGVGNTNPNYDPEGRDSEVVGVTDYYITNNVTYQKQNYASNFGDGFFHMGKMSFLTFTSSVNAAKASSETESYTIQFIAQRVGSDTLNSFLGDRINIGESGTNITINTQMQTIIPKSVKHALETSILSIPSRSPLTVQIRTQLTSART